jgi:4-hydroxybenzoate polyprenyltransferase
MSRRRVLSGMMFLILKLARPIQWIKNGVVLAPLIFAGQFGETGHVKLALVAVAVFCLLSSAVYILNDILDRESDRQHPLKKNRPLASGKLSVVTASMVALLLFAGAMAVAFVIRPEFGLIAALFVIVNLLYSAWLKHIVILDVMTISLSFAIRAYAGAVAIDVPASKWMIISTLLLALFLALGKRRHELVILEDNATKHRRSLLNYSPYLLDQLIGVVTASVVVSYMLYTFSDEVAERVGTQWLFVTIPFVIYGVFRYLYLIHKEDKGGDPTRLLFSDTPTLLNVILWIIAVTVILTQS